MQFLAEVHAGAVLVADVGRGEADGTDGALVRPVAAVAPAVAQEAARETVRGGSGMAAFAGVPAAEGVGADVVGFAEVVVEIVGRGECGAADTVDGVVPLAVAGVGVRSARCGRVVRVV